MSKDVVQKSWDANAAEWVRIIDGDKIPSRAFTNSAIINTLRQRNGHRILDVGCGEGWLAREMIKNGRTVTGIDATEALLLAARKKGPGTFYQMTYEEIMEGKLIPDHPFNIAVFNFCLYQKDGLSVLLKNTAKALVKNGFLCIQTLHPLSLVLQELPYKSQWIDNSWKGLPGNFVDGHSWYARTMEDWVHVFGQSNLKLVQMDEVLSNEQKPVAVIFTLKQDNENL